MAVTLSATTTTTTITLFLFTAQAPNLLPSITFFNATASSKHYNHYCTPGKLIGKQSADHIKFKFFQVYVLKYE